MAQVYFHCSNSERALIDQHGTAARDHATSVVRSLVTSMSPEDWRDWVMHVSDDLDEEIFAVSFASVLGKPH
jgi:chlorite dismutase